MAFSDKKSARRYFLDKRFALTAEQNAKASKRLCEMITALNEFKAADTVLLFYPSRNEPNLLNTMEKAIELGKTVAFPISFSDTCTLGFRCVSSLSELKTGTYGISEPPLDAPAPKLTSSSLCIVPALAIDKRGYRIGYGKGYYDRFLSEFVGISLCAVTNGFLCDALPIEHTDIPLDILITETGVIRIQ